MAVTISAYGFVGNVSLQVTLDALVLNVSNKNPTMQYLDIRLTQQLRIPPTPTLTI